MFWYFVSIYFLSRYPPETTVTNMFAPENQCLENEIPGFPCGARTLAKGGSTSMDLSCFCPVPCPKSTKMWWSWKTPTPPPPRKLTWLAGKSTIWRCISYWRWGFFSDVMFVFRGGNIDLDMEKPSHQLFSSYMHCRIASLPHILVTGCLPVLLFFCKSHLKGTKNTFASAKHSSEVMSWYRN